MSLWWSELIHPASRQQDTRTRVYVGGPIDYIAETAIRTGNDVTIPAASALVVPYGEIAPGDPEPLPDHVSVMYVTNAAAFLSRGAVILGDQSWFTYQSRRQISAGLWRLEYVQPIVQGAPTAFPAGTAVSQWRDATDDITGLTLSGEMRSNEGSWELSIKGVNWNSQRYFQDASILVVQRKRDEYTDWTSWHCAFVGYLDSPEPSKEPDQGTLWQAQARGLNKYLRLRQVGARVYGTNAVAGQRTASSVLKDPTRVSRDVRVFSSDMGPDRTADSNRLTFWAATDMPITQQQHMKRGISGNRANWLKDYGLKIQSLFIAAPQGGRWTRQEQLWIELYNPRDPEDFPNEQGEPQPDKAGELINNLILENNFGQRVYLGWKNGNTIDTLRCPPLNSTILCHTEAAFRAQFKAPHGSLVYEFRQCDGYDLRAMWQNRPPGQRLPTNVAYYGVGAGFRLDPAGGWVAIRRARKWNPAVISSIDWDEETERFGEEWLDFVWWGNPAFAAPPVFWTRIPDVDEDIYTEQGGVWSGGPAAPGGIPIGKSLRRTGRSPYAIMINAPPAMGGGVRESEMEGENAPGDWNLDSGTASDWSVDQPKIGNEGPAESEAWIRVKLGEFPAPIVLDDSIVDGHEWITVDNALYMPPASDQRHREVRTDFWYAPINDYVRLRYDRKIGNRLRVAWRNCPHNASINLSERSVLPHGTKLTLLIPAPRLGLEPESGSQTPIYANLYQLSGVGWHRHGASGPESSFPTHYAIRITGMLSPSDPQTYTGANPDWYQLAWVEWNSKPHGYHSCDAFVDPPFVSEVFFVIRQMSDYGIAMLNELSCYVIAADGRPEDPFSKAPVPSSTYTVGDIINVVMNEAGVPVHRRRIVAPAAVRSLPVAAGSAWSAIAELAKIAGCVVIEQRDGTIVVMPDLRSDRAIAARTEPSLTITPHVARGSVRVKEKPRHQAGQVRLSARSDVGQYEWTVAVPVIPLTVGGVVTASARLAESEDDAYRMANQLLRTLNGGWTIEVGVGFYDAIELLDIVRVDGLIIDEAGIELRGRTFYVAGARYDIDSSGMVGALKLEELRL